jgi:hypothetical protein
MDGSPGTAKRIVVMARPALARAVAAILDGDGFELYRTPDDAGLVALVARVRPHLVIIALDMPWADSMEAPHHWVGRLHPVPVLVIGESDVDASVDEIARLSSPLAMAALRKSVGRLLGSNLEPDT